MATSASAAISLHAVLDHLARSGGVAAVVAGDVDVELEDAADGFSCSPPAALAKALALALDAVSAAAFVVDSGGGVLAESCAARKLAQSHQVVLNGQRDPKLCRLAGALVQAIRDGAPEARTILRSDEGPLLLEATRLDTGASSGDDLFILVARHPSTREPLEARVRAAFGLTVAEGSVAACLCDGLSTEEIAERRAVSVETVRRQLRDLFAKTETHRQSQLVSVLLAYA
jgi:DNA-binding CsgD family transcriptional regulator